jgi:hypothetical protein
MLTLDRLMTRPLTAAIGKELNLPAPPPQANSYSKRLFWPGNDPPLSRAVLKLLIDGQNHELAGSGKGAVA